MTEEKVALTPEGEVKFERWQKHRIFVRELSGKYGEIYRQLLDQPRVYSSKAKKFKEGPARFSKGLISPSHAKVAQSIETHIDVIGPGTYGQKHGHMNGAVFFILNGKGYDVHDEVRYDWEAGDACIVENACVHRHYNADPESEARVLVIKAKPLYLFFHLLFQKVVEYPPEKATPGFEDWKPEE